MIYNNKLRDDYSNYTFGFFADVREEAWSGAHFCFFFFEEFLICVRIEKNETGEREVRLKYLVVSK